MLNCPYEDYCSSFFRENRTPSFLRIFHASPNTPAVDVYINNKPVAKRLFYRNFSDYLPTAAGTYTLQVFRVGQRINPLVSTRINIPEGSIRTIAITGTLPNLSTLPVLEQKFKRIPGKAYIKFAQLSPNTPNVDLTASRLGKIYRDVSYREVTNYIAVNPGTYTFDLNLTQGGQRVLHVPNIRLLPNRIYTLYSVGLLGKTPPLQLIVPLDGNTYLR